MYRVKKLIIPVTAATTRYYNMLDSVILWFDYEVDNLDNDWATLLVGLCLKVPGL